MVKRKKFQPPSLLIVCCKIIRYRGKICCLSILTLLKLSSEINFPTYIKVIWTTSDQPFCLSKSILIQYFPNVTIKNAHANSHKTNLLQMFSLSCSKSFQSELFALFMFLVKASRISTFNFRVLMLADVHKPVSTFILLADEKYFLE